VGVVIDVIILIIVGDVMEFIDKEEK